jgi:hypothetical protein
MQMEQQEHSLAFVFAMLQAGNRDRPEIRDNHDTVAWCSMLAGRTTAAGALIDAPMY